MSFASDAEQRSFVAAHPDLYAKGKGPARLRIEKGQLRLGSLLCAGFAVAGKTDFAAMRPMPAASKTAIVPSGEKVRGGRDSPLTPSPRHSSIGGPENRAGRR